VTGLHRLLLEVSVGSAAVTKDSKMLLSLMVMGTMTVVTVVGTTVMGSIGVMGVRTMTVVGSIGVMGVRTTRVMASVVVRPAPTVRRSAVTMGRSAMRGTMRGLGTSRNERSEPVLENSTRQRLQVFQHGEFIQKFCDDAHQRRELLRRHQSGDDDVALGIHVPLSRAVDGLGENRGLEHFLDSRHHLGLSQSLGQVRPRNLRLRLRFRLGSNLGRRRSGGGGVTRRRRCGSSSDDDTEDFHRSSRRLGQQVLKLAIGSDGDEVILLVTVFDVAVWQTNEG
jgi:hypothetical protein